MNFEAVNFAYFAIITIAVTSFFIASESQIINNEDNEIVDGENGIKRDENRINGKKLCEITRGGRKFFIFCKEETVSNENANGNKSVVLGTPCQTREGLPGFCQTSTFCFSQYNNLEDYAANTCLFGNNDDVPGICCPKQRRDHIDIKLSVRIPNAFRPSPVKLPFISMEDVNKAAEESHKLVNQIGVTEQALIQSGNVQKPGSTQAQHQAFFGDFNKLQSNLSKIGLINLFTSIKLKERFQLTNKQSREGLLFFSLANTDLSKYCSDAPKCNKQSKYRTADGSCNNLEKPQWGKSNTAFTRIITPAYADGLNAPRISKNGTPLPSARKVSVEAGIDRNNPDKHFSLFVMDWGQFIDHDLTLAASTRPEKGLLCCGNELAETKHPACFTIRIPENDQFYSKFNETCIDFLRNAPSPGQRCNLGHREQMNTLTHFIDASMVYGSTEEKTNELRSLRNGKLKISKVNDLQFLPFTKGSSRTCGQPNRSTNNCLSLAGDGRINAQPGLVMLHNLFLREHNRLTEELSVLNPQWSDEIIFQETRRIIAAQIQHITYNEWLPLILGRTVMTRFNILPKAYGYDNDYDPSLEPTIINSFAASAFRFHTFIPGFLELFDKSGQIIEKLQLRNEFRPNAIYQTNAFDKFINGFSMEPSQKFDKFYTEEITNHLFEERGKGFGKDLVALNIQRGRDHGIPGYNVFRKLCGLKPLSSFEQLNEVMHSRSAQTFANLYNSVDDIDFFIAGSHEMPILDAAVGPTVACIVAEQFRRLKLGDRFWYENGGQSHSFSETQLIEIRKSSLARLLCDNGDQINLVQPLAFLQPIKSNERIACEKLGFIDINAWKEEQV